ncbi:DUF2946 family protein [Azospirillum griseum]|uniref:DUF2946 domain-containing protein n=1 Tax=Azospirillum griseum TaxID=2496639 RepID=A0A431VBM8_9PROT|nr:DUF2946 family protein [Azospirillum griseum]RTR15861.1 hypothetical protein EJ903_22260 [Azospirillum griseum]
MTAFHPSATRTPAGHLFGLRPDRRRRIGASVGVWLLLVHLLALGGHPPRADAPSSPLFAQDLSGDRIVICTAGGMVVIDRATGQPVPPDADRPHGDLCLFCLPGLQGGTDLPTVATLALPVATLCPPLYSDRPHPPPAARPVGVAWPRGPPWGFPT